MKYVIGVWNAADNHSIGMSPDEIYLEECEKEEQAENIAYEYAVSNYEMYGGMYGLVLEGDDCENCSGDGCAECNYTGQVTEDVAKETMESNLSYTVELYEPEKHDEWFVNVGMAIPE